MDLDYYKILGVNKNASHDEIKKAYKKLAVKYHPDKNEGELLSEEIFKSVKEAYDTLSDTHKKSRYDNLQTYKKQTSTHSAQTARPKAKTYTKNHVNKNESISNTKVAIIGVSVILFITTIALAVYPAMNKWASNDKLASAYKSAEMQNWAEAQVQSSEAIALWDENGKAYLLRGQINGSRYFKDYRQAISDFNAAESLLPSDSILGEHYYMMAKAHHEFGDTETACEKLKNSLDKGFERAIEDYKIICD